MAKNVKNEVNETVISTEDTVITNDVAQVKKATPLTDSDEIEVVALIPNVSYKDSKSGDFYEWDEVGHVEYMTFDTLKNMWRNHKGYFRNMCLKPNDERVISKFGLTKTYEKYDYLMDAKNYKKSNLDKLNASINETPNALKFALMNKIKSYIVNGEVTDISVIKGLGKYLKVDFTSFID